MKFYFAIVVLFFTASVCAQSQTPLYKGLIYKMKISEAKKEFRNNKQYYKIISFGNGVNWHMYPMKFSANAANELVGVNLNAGSVYGDDSDTTRVYLTQSFEFFLDKGYSIYYEPDYWDNPLLFDATNKYGLLLHDADKTIMISLRAISHPTHSYNYVPILAISNFDAFVQYMETEKINIKATREKTGF